MSSLQSYLEKHYGEKKKKKKKRPATKGRGGVVIRDLDPSIVPREDDAEDIREQEDAPVVVSMAEALASQEAAEPQVGMTRGKFRAIGEGESTKQSVGGRNVSPAPARRRARHDSDSEDEDESSRVMAAQKRRHDSDSEGEEHVQSRRCRRRSAGSPGSDLSPPRSRRVRHDSGNSDEEPARTAGADEDLSPPRQRRVAADVDEDLSPPRARADADGDLSPPRSRPSRMDDDGDLEVPRASSRPLPGGVQRADVLKEDIQRRKEMEREKYMALGEAAGAGAETVHRDKSGRRVDMKLMRLKQREAERKKEEEMEKNMKWGRGLVQTEEREARLEDEVREMDKPFARHADDADLNERLKSQILPDDPMAAYMVQKQRKAKKTGLRPVYKGPPPPPNRFGIAPGHRWDGVDRSNGFENKLLSMQANLTAHAEDAQRWSQADM